MTIELGLFIFVTGSVFDFLTSIGGREAILFSRDKYGRFSPWKNIAVKAGALAVVFALCGFKFNSDFAESLAVGGFVFLIAGGWNLYVRRKSNGN